MRLRAGLTAPSPGWESLLRTEGIGFGLADPGRIDPADWSVLAVTQYLSAERKRDVREYLDGGGAVIAPARFGHYLIGGTLEQRRVEYLLSDRVPWDTIHLADLCTDCFVPSGANSLPDEKGQATAYVGRIGEGLVVLLPFDPPGLISDHRRVMRKFHARRERLPFEEVSVVSKGEIVRMVGRVLEYLHHSRGLPYVRPSAFPHGAENQFAFRIDTDGAPEADIRELSRLAAQYDIPLTWFVDVGSHEKLMPLFRSFGRDEIALHCYEHRLFQAAAELQADVLRARAVFTGHGIEAMGYAAPYGFWNEETGRAILASEFSYSSEFSFVYDSVPLRPFFEGTSSGVLQIPVHPVCIGSLRRLGYDDIEMNRYFDRSVSEKLLRGDPLFYYHHPAHRSWDVVESMFRGVSDRGIPGTTLGQFAEWWKVRCSAQADIDLNGEAVVVHRGSDPSVNLRVSLPDGRAGLARGAEGPIDMSRVNFRTMPQVAAPVGITATREADLRTSIAGWYNHIMRRSR